MNWEAVLNSKRVVAPLSAEALHILEKHVKPTDFVVETGEALRQQALQAAEELCRWLSPAIDLSDYSFRYPIDGITDGLNHWLLNESREIHTLVGEYEWINGLKKVTKVNDISEIPNGGLLYVSNPFSSTGNFLSQWKEWIQRDIRIVLDAAYLGTTALGSPLQLSDRVEMVLFSFSKMLGFHSLGVGYCFSRKPVESLDKLLRHGYLRAPIPLLTQKLTAHLELDSSYKIWRSRQEAICNELNLVPSDSILIATSEQKAYDRLKREDGTHRICLTPLYLQLS